MTTIDEDNKLPDFIVTDAEGFKDIKRLPQMKSVAPKIKWGFEYSQWPDHKKVCYLERLCATMNHAADVLQQERDKLLVILETNEKQIKQLHNQIIENTKLFNTKYGELNESRQELLARLQGIESGA